MSPTKRSGLRRDAGSVVPARTPSKPKKGRKSKVKEPALSPQEMFDARKDTLIQEKRTEGNAIAYRHENMVSCSSSHDSLELIKLGRAIQLHEMFHLKERTILLDYDPEVRIVSPVCFISTQDRNQRLRAVTNLRTSSRYVFWSPW